MLVPGDEISTRAPSSLGALHADLIAESQSSINGKPWLTMTFYRLLRMATQLRDDPVHLRADLVSLLDNPARLAEVEERSKIHPHGFAKIVLYLDEQFSIRLHIWKRRDGLWVDEAQPHGHRWEFASWIVAGTLREVVLSTESRDEPGDRYGCYDYVRDESGAPRLKKIGDTVLYRTSEVDRVADTVYGQTRATLHTATPVSDGLVASLVLQGPHDGSPAPVCVRAGQRPLEGETVLGVDRLRSLVAEVVAALSEAHVHIPAQRTDRLMR
jgi:hypothetical protein